MSVSGQENFDPGISLYLEDCKTAVFYDLRQISSFPFISSEEDASDRFRLHLGGTFGISPHKIESGTRIYAYGNTIYIQNRSGIPEEEKLLVFNLLGQEVLNQQLSYGPVNAIPFNREPGYYIVRVIRAESTTECNVVIH